MNQTSKTLLSALIISLFSLATLQGYRVITQTGSPQVLGDTTVKSVPCDVINSWQKQYCSVGSTTPILPTPLPTTACRGGYYGGTYGPSCNNSSISSYYLKFACADNYPGTVGDVNLKTCYNMNDLVNMAYSFCSSHSVCSAPTRAPSPVPTVRVVTPTRAPSSVPTRAPTITPTPTASGAFSLKLSNPVNEITCKLSDPNCYYQTVIIGTNRTDNTIYYTSLWTSGSNISYTYNGATITNNSVSTSSLVIDPGQEAFNTLVNVTPPKTVGTYYSYFYADGKNCNTQTSPPNCIYYGGSSLYVKINVVN
ncbi:MAG: hypothetical protein NTY75_02175 [Candidatus Shapirobacteria bacterium]|nr:hypothetical protein [Candidatus Shapirobacteria bacterium]